MFLFLLDNFIKSVLLVMLWTSMRVILCCEGHDNMI